MTTTQAGRSSGGTGVGSRGGLVRVSVRGVGHGVDLVVPAGTTVRDLLAGHTDAGPGAVLAQVGGRVLDADTGLGEQGVGDGDLLVVIDPDAAPGGSRASRRSGSRRLGSGRSGARRSSAGRSGAERPGRGSGDLPVELALLPGALAVAAVAAGWAASADTIARWGIAAGLLLAAALVALGPRLRVLVGGAEALAPAFAGAAAVALLPRAEPGEDLLAIVAAGVVAAQAAAVTRMVATAVAEPALVVWLWTGAVVAGLGAAVLAADGAVRVVWALLAVAAVAGVRLVPSVAIDVPDEQLLDVEEMAHTSWSARAGGARRRLRVRPRQVRAGVQAGRRLLDAAAVTLAAVTAAAGIALALDPGVGWTRWFAYATGGLAGVALMLCAREYGGALPRVALGLGGLIAAAGAAGGLLAEAPTVGLYGVAGGAAALAVPVLAVAVALGHGWRSVWWSRLGDGLRGLAVVAVFPVAVVGAGAFEYFRQLFS